MKLEMKDKLRKLLIRFASFIKYSILFEILRWNMYFRRIILFLLFPLLIILLKDNQVTLLYTQDPFKVLGVVTGGISALITMLIFIINFNVNDIYLGKSKSKCYLEERVLIQFIKSVYFKWIYIIFLVISLKLSGISVKSTFIYNKLNSINFLKRILYLIEINYKDIGVYCFLILTLVILLTIMGNIEQLFKTMMFKENEMYYLKRKIEKSIKKEYEVFFNGGVDVFFTELTIDYIKVKDEDKDKFTQIIFDFIRENYYSKSHPKIDIVKLDDYLNNKYIWIQENIKNIKTQIDYLVDDIDRISNLDKNKYNDFVVNNNTGIYVLNDNEDIRLKLINKFTFDNEENECIFYSKLLESINVTYDEKFIGDILHKVTNKLLKYEVLENNVFYQLVEKCTNNRNSNMINEVLLIELYDRDLENLDRKYYLHTLELLEDEYIIAWALYKVFEEKSYWSVNVDFAFEVLYQKNFDIIKYNRHLQKEQQGEEYKVEKILSLLDMSRLSYRITEKCKLIFECKNIQINYELEKDLCERDIEWFKFILIYNWKNKINTHFLYNDSYFNADIEQRERAINILGKLDLFVEYSSIKKIHFLYSMLYEICDQNKEIVLSYIDSISNWKVLLLVEELIHGVLEYYYHKGQTSISNKMIVAYFDVLLNKEKYYKLYHKKKFKKIVKNSLLSYVRYSKKTLTEIINEFEQYQKLTEIDSIILKRKIDDIIISYK